VIVLLAGSAFMLPPRADRINYANFLRIDEQMTRDQVEAILGPPNFSASALQTMGYADFHRRIESNWEKGSRKSEERSIGSATRT
jgi:hypothetical protein